MYLYTDFLSFFPPDSAHDGSFGDFMYSTKNISHWQTNGSGGAWKPILIIPITCSGRKVMICSYSRYGFLSLDGVEAPFQNIPPSLSVIMLFCLKPPLRPNLSLCHSVSKHPSVPIRHSVILSKPIPPSLSVIMSFCLKTSLWPYLSFCHSV